jgi:hypothetical protein
MTYENEMRFRKACSKCGTIGAFIEGVYLGLYYTFVPKGNFKAYSRGYAVGDWIARNSKGR